MKVYFLVIALIFPVVIFSQMNKLEFKVGAEYRITPISNSPDVFISQIPVNFNQDNQISGTAFNYSLAYIFKNGFGLAIQQSVRYDHIYFDVENLSNPTELTVNKSVNGIITDFKFFIVKHFYLTDYKSVFIELGGSIMNRGTAYSVTRQIGTDLEDNLIFATFDQNFNHGAINSTLGFVYNKFDIGIGAYFVDGTGANFGTEDNIIIPYLKLNYILGRKN